MRIAMIDNYDSFTYNLVQYLSEAGASVEVVRNDATTAQALLAGSPDGVVISPGSGEPSSTDQEFRIEGHDAQRTMTQNGIRKTMVPTKSIHARPRAESRPSSTSTRTCAFRRSVYAPPSRNTTLNRYH